MRDNTLVACTAKSKKNEVKFSRKYVMWLLATIKKKKVLTARGT